MSAKRPQQEPASLPPLPEPDVYGAKWPRAYSSKAMQEYARAAVGVALEKLDAAVEFIQRAPHGENCFVSDHYESDPGNHCHCGKDALLSWLESETVSAAQQEASKDAQRLVWASSKFFDERIRTEFVQHVLHVGGAGDLSDCRTFIDKAMQQEGDKP
jgi:hypothetical protein